MRGKLSVKLGLLFFVLMLVIEIALFFILYITISNHRVSEVMEGLLARGAGHRDVLENNYDSTTLEHVVLMESEASTDVIITDENGNIKGRSSDEDVEFQSSVVRDIAPVKVNEDRIIEEKWAELPYVATVSPIFVDGVHKGEVFMFSRSGTIRNTLNHLSEQFLLVMLLIGAVTLVVVFALSQIITRPLIRMQQVTEKLSAGKADRKLDERHNDELGSLAVSINSLSEDLERLKKDRNNFLSSIAHELRTPLTYVKGYAEVASRTGTSDEERVEYLAIIREEINHLTSLVQQLFQLAKMEENSFVIEPSVIELTPLLVDVRSQMQPLFEERQAGLSISSPEEVFIYGDAVRLKQVFYNLLNNSVFYGYESPQVEINVTVIRGEVHILVSDNGPGVPEETLPYLFERLYRVDKARSRKYGGSGLGLSIVKEIIEKHEGTVHAFNDNGLSILIKLPEEKNYD
ncbi:HAMP domain-containing sensor histidine kinase [Salimicrobium humidisoli]|uniref:histidine kinase n=1 Tax=Salimicrobium humidisoli TaxID=2029857 RepID=A0ABX4HTM9_9BACI|nr:ATP-binding protein [Salimicrobium humidisoli]PBB06174.1 two-component sensor histidine kinase [Salimicrobium humidisoli]